MQTETLATELLKEIKISAKRWFVAFCIMVVLEVLTVVGFMWYISLPVEETTVTQETSGNSNQLIGIGDNYGSEADGGSKTQGNTQQVDQ